WIDPIVGLLIVLTILFGTWGLLRDSVSLIMDGVPLHVDPIAVKTFLARLPGVTAVHDLHIWGLSTNEVALTAHLVMPERRLSDQDYRELNTELKQRFAIHHVTIQIESNNSPAGCASGTVCCDPPAEHEHD